ncbi:MAG: hypothetical protein ING44_03100 [Telmatospirillum sp.]|jgi:hypothetical protein|nr:hypothetical protein [Telmatospirillum sp.]
MEPRSLFAIALAISLANGTLSPWLPWIAFFVPFFLPEIVPLTRETVFYSASFMLGMGTLLAGGVAAAIYEGLTRQTAVTERAMQVWIAGCLFVSTPAVLRLLGL